MPILPAEPDIYPANLWHDGGPEPDPRRRWWCLHTKPRQEKTVARLLRRREIAHYLPQVVQAHRTPGGRTIRSVLPLFPGYLFLHGDHHERVEAMQGNHLANILDVGDQRAIQRDLHQVHLMLSSGLPVTPERAHVVGERIRITAGPLRGIVGTVIRRGDRDHFVAQVRFLGCGATIKLQDWQAEAISA